MSIESMPDHVRERAAIYEYDANMRRELAEERAIREYRLEQSKSTSTASAYAHAPKWSDGELTF